VPSSAYMNLRITSAALASTVSASSRSSGKTAAISTARRRMRRTVSSSKPGAHGSLRSRAAAASARAISRSAKAFHVRPYGGAWHNQVTMRRATISRHSRSWSWLYTWPRPGGSGRQCLDPQARNIPEVADAGAAAANVPDGVVHTRLLMLGLIGRPVPTILNVARGRSTNRRIPIPPECLAPRDLLAAVMAVTHAPTSRSLCDLYGNHLR
jgi:hypothetical protein